jgi:Flp pilus assembly protein TadG
MKDLARTRGRLPGLVASVKHCIAGVVAIEFAIAAPVLVIDLICTADLGLAIYRKMQVENAAQAGAEYAVVHGFGASSIATAVTQATSFSDIASSPEPFQFCGCASDTGITTADCSSTCTGGRAPGTYVTVSAQGTYKTILHYPMIPDNFTFAAQSTVRLQ